MNEWSESYHIRTDEPDVTTQKLVDSGIDGFIFTPKNGWLTFVPYDLDEKLIGGVLTDDLIALSGKAVLNYVSNDYSWGFEYKRPEAQSKMQPHNPEFWFQYDCQSDFDQNIRDKDGNLEYANFDHAAFCRVLGRPDLETQLRTILQIVDLDEIDEAEYPDSFDSAWKFSGVLGLPVYEYLSSRHVQNDPRGYAEYGIRRIGPEPMTWRATGTVPAAGEAHSAKTSAKPSDNFIDLLKGLLGRRD